MRICELRKAHGLPQKVLAAYLHICQSSYVQYETEKRDLPIDLLIRLAFFYETSVDYLLGLTDEPAPYPSSGRR